MTRILLTSAALALAWGGGVAAMENGGGAAFTSAEAKFGVTYDEGRGDNMKLSSSMISISLSGPPAPPMTDCSLGHLSNWTATTVRAA